MLVLYENQTRYICTPINSNMLIHRIKLNMYTMNFESILMHNTTVIHNIYLISIFGPISHIKTENIDHIQFSKQWNTKVD